MRAQEFPQGGGENSKLKVLGKFCLNIGHQGLRPPPGSAVDEAPPGIPMGGDATPASPCTRS